MIFFCKVCKIKYIPYKELVFPHFQHQRAFIRPILQLKMSPHSRTAKVTDSPSITGTNEPLHFALGQNTYLGNLMVRSGKWDPRLVFLQKHYGKLRHRCNFWKSLTHMSCVFIFHLTWRVHRMPLGSLSV